jgi:outer membrane protein TolC
MTPYKVALVLLSVPLIAGAQLELRVPPVKLTLRQAVLMALANGADPRLELTEVAARQAEARVREETSALRPSVDAYITGQGLNRSLDAFGLGSVQLPGKFEFPATVGPFGILDTRVTASQDLLGLAARRRVAASHSEAGAVKEESRAARNTIAAQVATRYLAVLRVAGLEEASRAGVMVAEAWLDTMRHRQAAGQATALDVSRAAAQLSGGRQRLAEGESDRVVAVLELLRETGLSMETGLELTDTLEALRSPEGDVAEMVQTALRNRAELTALEKRIESDRLNERAAEAESLPTLTAFADFGALGSARIWPTYTIGLTLRVPLFDGGRREAHRAETLADVRQDELRAADLRRQIELDVRRAYEKLRLAGTQIEATQESVELASEELTHARRRFDAGLLLGVEIMEAQSRLARAKDERVAAQYRRGQAIVELASAMGVCDSFF